MRKQKLTKNIIRASALLFGLSVTSVIVSLVLLNSGRKDTPTPTPGAGYAPLPQTGITQLPASSFGKPVVDLVYHLISPPSAAMADRYGVIITGFETKPDLPQGVQHVLNTTQANWWYHYIPRSVELANSKARQVYLIRTWFGGKKNNHFIEWMEYIRKVGKFNQPTYWLIGNEPNVLGQDNTSPEEYAEALFEANQAIRAADPQATIIGPNVLNWTVTCKGCPGFSSGFEWTNQMREIYRQKYNREPPFDIWSLHTYSLDWTRLPLINQAQDAEQVEAFRRYLDNFAVTKDKPIWLTEFGVIWGYDNIEWQQKADSSWTALPRGNYRQDLIEEYLRNTITWLERHSNRLNLQRWFVFTSYGGPEVYSTAFSGIALFDAPATTANLTNYGRIYSGQIKKHVKNGNN